MFFAHLFVSSPVNMTKPTLFKEYIWLINSMVKARYISLRELNELWLETEMSGGVEMSRTTFYRHKCAIEDMFGIIIDFDRQRGKYFISNEDVLNSDSVQNWILQTLSMSNLLGESQSLHERIVPESVPSVTGRMEPVIKAMKKSVRLQMTYCKYDGSDAKSCDVAPYCIKLYHQRWYLLAKNEDGQMRLYAFDRMQRIDVSATPFVLDPDFDAQAYFADCFGVVRIEGVAPQRIVVRAFGNEADYLRSLPLHKSQREMASGEDYTDFEYFMRPTLDLCGQILSRGARLKVIFPQSLAEQVHQMLREAAQNYDR